MRFDLERAAAVVGFVFGLATIAAGGTVLLGRDPGYSVYRPLVAFNTVMGLVYVWVGVAAWRRQAAGRTLAGVIAVVNAMVWCWVFIRFMTGGHVVAEDSVRAMTLRVSVWVVLYAVLVWVWRRKRAATGPS
jgi:hypothetical protein